MPAGMSSLRPKVGSVAMPIAAAVTVVAVVVVAREVDVDALAAALGAARRDTAALLVVLAVYGTAFVARAWAWTRVVPELPVGQALAGIHLALAGNHLLPFRLGEAARVTSVVRRAGIEPALAVSSTVTLRGGDLAALAGLSAVLGLGVVADVSGPGAWLLVALAVGLVVFGVGWLRRLRVAMPGRVRLPGVGVTAATVVAWALEAVVVWQAAAWAGVHLSVAEAVVVTTVTVAAQVAAIAPGGFGTYEAAGTAVLVTLGVPAPTALAIALTAHAVKTAYALGAGAVAVFVPAPGIVGRLRLPRTRPTLAPAAVPDGPVVLFLPAYNEQDTVADVVRRCPARVHDREVICLVVDDGSTDATVERARGAGAVVVSQDRNRGLGAAVRRGFAEAVDLGAAAVAFCDADGEYAPEQLGDVVAPILDGDADYVVGSRFDGEIRRMLPHRRLGNLVLTAWTRWVARTPISDGQSGYRALSRRAAIDAVVEHDFNYAQVLTLDLLGRGHRYAEVPIGYAFREHGRSFIRLGRYLRAVVPAVHRVVNRVPA